MKRLEEIIKRLNGATKGEWHYNDSSCVLTMGQLKDMEMGEGKYNIVAPFIQFSMNRIHGDFKFIENSKNDVEYLIDEVKRLRRLDSLNLKPKEDIISYICRCDGEIQVLRMKMHNLEDNDKYQSLSRQESKLGTTIDALRWVLGQR